MPPARLGHRIVDIERATIDRYLREQPLARQARLVQTWQRGRAAGIKLYAVRTGSLLALLGLRDGDVITALNSRPVAGDDRSWSAAMTSAPNFIDLSVNRAGDGLRIIVLIHP